MNKKAQISWWIPIVIVILVGAVFYFEYEYLKRRNPNDYVVCGIGASCPKTHDIKWIGGQCLNCFIRDKITVSEFNMTKICEEYLQDFQTK